MKTMLDIFKERLIEGLFITKVKEYHNKYVIECSFEGDKTNIDLWKTCQPGCEEIVCDRAVITAISTIYFNKGNFIKAKEWLDKLTEGSENHD